MNKYLSNEEIQESIEKILVEDKLLKDKYGFVMEDMDFLSQDGVLYDVDVKDIDFKNKTIVVEDGLEHISYLLDKEVQLLSAEMGFALDNDWYIVKKVY